MFTRGGGGVGGQKKTNLVNVVCERPLSRMFVCFCLGLCSTRCVCKVSESQIKKIFVVY